MIEKGEIYEKTIFAGKVEHFKEKAFQAEVKQTYIDKLTYPWKKVKALKELSDLVNRRDALEDSLAETVKKRDVPIYGVL